MDEEVSLGAIAKSGQERNIEVVREWVKRHKPDVILGFNTAFYWLLLEAGCQIPEQIDFINLWSFGTPSDPRGFSLHPDEVGRRAVEWLDALLRIGQRGLPLHPTTIAVNLIWKNNAEE